ncbi:MAG: sulfotransferase [Myxococcota bacterium]|nr:sulfotransferase [Myxococcota bacterium]
MKPETRFRGARADRPALLNLANSLLGWAGRWLPFDAAALERAAGKDDPELAREGLLFRSELEELCESVERESALNLVGRFAARDDTARMVRTQLRARRALRDDPVDGVQLLPPLYILGWPRTGTTFLLGLLAEDPAHRSLPYYESFDPVSTLGIEARVKKVDAMLRSVDWLSPHYQSIHAMKGDDPEECVALFMLAFRTLQFDIQYRAPSYARFLLETSPREAYSFYLDLLRLVQRARPQGERWLLKDPTHLLALDTLLDFFPQGRFVLTHRDPAAALGSISSLYAHTRSLFSDDVDPLRIGPEILAGYWPAGMERALAVRDANPEARVVDLRYGDLLRDPLATVERLYGLLELELSDEARRGMERYVREHPQNPERVHRYSLEQFGLREDEVRERFAPYCERFGIEPEKPSS